MTPMMAVRTLKAITKMQWKYWCRINICIMELMNISPASRKPHQVGAVGSEINLMSMLPGEDQV